MAQLRCPHLATDGINNWCLNGRFPCDCEACDCDDKFYVEVLSTTNTAMPETVRKTEGQVFKEGAEWMAEQAVDWLAENIRDYVSWDGEIDTNITFDFQRALETLIQNKKQ